MRKKFRLCKHGEIYINCPICKDKVNETKIEKMLERKIIQK